MSFSGLKTAMLNLIHNTQQKGEDLPVADLAASFSAAVSDELIPGPWPPPGTWAMARWLWWGRGRQLPHPPGPGGGLPPGRLHPLPAPLKLCGDNGSMIGSQGYYEYLAGVRAGADLNAYANRDISLGYPGP